MEKAALLSLMLILCLGSVDWIVKNVFSMYAVTKKKTSRQHRSLKDSKLNWIFLISEDMFGKYNNMHNNIRFKKIGYWHFTFKHGNTECVLYNISMKKHINSKAN